MKRIAIYARYSSDKQNPKSVDDQIADCKEFIAKNFDSGVLVSIFEDHALSGQTTRKRTGYQELIDAIENDRVSFVVIEDLDRLTRSMGDLDGLYHTCKFKDVEIIPLRMGRVVTLLDIGIKGIINAAYIDNLRNQILRAQRNRAKEGKIVGMSYGYKMKIRNGREITGERDIDAEKAVVVREIFELYAENHSLGSIVNILNARGIPSPKGKLWSKHGLLGARSRNEGLLRNEIYRGKIIWNKRSYRINPKTNGRSCRMNPESERNIYHKEELRIIPEELWLRCQIRMHEKEKINSQSNVKFTLPRTRMVNPLRGLAFCGVCGARKVIANNTRYICSSFKSSRACPNARGRRFASIIEEVFQHFTEALESKSQQGWVDEIKQILDSEQQKKDEILAEIESISQKIYALADVIERQEGEIEELAIRIKDLDNKRNVLKVHLEEISIDIGSDIKNTISENLTDLRQKLKQPQIDDTARVQLLLLIDKIVLTPTVERVGEHISITLKPNAWLDYYRFLQTKAGKHAKGCLTCRNYDLI